MGIDETATSGNTLTMEQLEATLNELNELNVMKEEALDRAKNKRV